jgi:hypothetical protein
MTEIMDKQLTLEDAIEQLQQLKARVEAEQSSTGTKAKGARGKGRTIQTQTITVSGHANKCSQIIHG